MTVQTPTFRKKLTLNIHSRRAFINSTPQVQPTMTESSIAEGHILINAMPIITPQCRLRMYGINSRRSQT